MVTQKDILKILYQLNQKKASTSLAHIGCILKGDKNSICTAYQDFEEFGTMDEKALKNMGTVFDDLIDSKLITVVSSGIFTKYEISKKGLDFLNIVVQEDNSDKYYSSIGTASDYLEENIKLSDTFQLIDKEVENIRENKMYNDVKPSDTGIDIEDIQNIASKKISNRVFEGKIDDLLNYKNKPYFGRMDLIESSNNGIDAIQLYIGDKNITIGNKQVVLNWRTEIASNFYDKKTNFQYNKSKYELQLIRNIEIENAKIKTVYNQLTKKKSELKDTISDPFLINVLKMKKDTLYFTDIIATIQEKQNEIIRLPLELNVIVQGCAGSGKTMILLHRLSYILYNYKKINPDNIKIITPSDLFDIFINDLSNQLELDNVERLSMLQMYVEHINQFFPIKKTSSLKNEISIGKKVLGTLYSNEFLSKLTSAIKMKMNDDILIIKEKNESAIREKHAKYLLLITEIDELINVKFQKEVGKLIDQLEPNNEFIQLLSFDHIKEFEEKLNKLIYNNVNIDVKIANIIQQIHLISEKNKYTDEIISDSFINDLVNIANSYKIKLFSNKKISTERYIRKYKEDLSLFNQSEIDKLTRDLDNLKEEILSTQELNKLKEVKKHLEHSINPIIIEVENKLTELQDEASKQNINYEKQMDSLNENIKTLQDHIKNYGENLIFIKDNMDFLNSSITTDIKISLDLNQYFETIVINEIDKLFSENDIKIRFHNQYKYYFYLKLAIMKYFGFTFKNLSLVMIDEAQEYAPSEIMLLKTIHPLANFNLYGDINQLTSPVGNKDWNNLKAEFKYYELSENYRNPKPVVEHINRELNMNMVPLGLENGIVSSVNIFYDFRIDAVIYLEDDKDEFVIQNKIPTSKIGSEKIFHIDDVKGLEFNTIVVYTKNMSNNQEYIAFSRALENLYVVKE